MQLERKRYLLSLAWVYLHDMAPTHSGKAAGITDRAEEYLEAILNMSVEGYKVVAVRLAERLKVSAPTVSAALRRLKRDELVEIDDKTISLTAIGYDAAVSIVRRHRLVERLLIDFLGIDWADVHEQACLLEHSISPLVEERLYERLGRPETCPHGNPIPSGSTLNLPECRSLTSVQERDIVKIVRVTEEVSDDKKMMRFLQEHSLTPETRFRVTSFSPQAQTLSLEPLAGGNTVVLSFEVANALFVAAADH